MKLPKGQNRTGLLFLLLAVVCGLLAAGLVLTAGAKMTPTIPVWVANAEITPGDPLNAAMFRTVNMPPSGLPPATIRPGIDLSGAIAAHGMAPGDVLRSSSIIQLESEPSLLSARLKALDDPALRAMEVPVEAAAGLLGGMKAGDRVDIISVHQAGSGQEAGFEAQTVIEAAPVIGVRAPGESPGVLVVALTTEQTETLAQAREQGKIFAALRPFGAGAEEGDKDQHGNQS